MDYQLDLPIPIRRALRQLGQDIKDARRRRRIPMSLMAERAALSRTTLTAIEKGSAAVTMGNYARVLFVLGMAEKLQNLVSSAISETEQRLSDSFLPQRIYLPRSAKKKMQKND